MGSYDAYAVTVTLFALFLLVVDVALTSILYFWHSKKDPETGEFSWYEKKRPADESLSRIVTLAVQVTLEELKDQKAPSPKRKKTGTKKRPTKKKISTREKGRATKKTTGRG